jgi:hypothetical protein
MNNYPFIQTFLPSDTITAILFCFEWVLLYILANKIILWQEVKKTVHCPRWTKAIGSGTTGKKNRAGLLQRRKKFFHLIRKVEKKIQSRSSLVFFITATAPLLGILGTVSGTQTAIHGMADADIAQKFIGLSRALDTTAAGITVAVTGFLVKALAASLYKRVFMIKEEASAGWQGD